MQKRILVLRLDYTAPSDIVLGTSTRLPNPVVAAIREWRKSRRHFQLESSRLGMAQARGCQLNDANTRMIDRSGLPPCQEVSDGQIRSSFVPYGTQTSIRIITL